MNTILVFGLPGSGKTTFATKLKELFGDRAIHFNGDEIRKTYNDWDFSEEGRRRQAERMRDAAINAHMEGKHAILDFVCPKEEYRNIVDADYLVYMDCPPVRNFEDTTAMFEHPRSILLWYVSSYREVDETVIELYNAIMDSLFDPTAPTGLMIGRFQPFHDGHKALFEKALEKHGQVCIAVRDMPQSANNPYTPGMVEAHIHKSLQKYRGKYQIVILPNIVDVVYGRDVGWTVSKIDLSPETEAISATKIREELNMNYDDDFYGAICGIDPHGSTERVPKIYESPNKGKTVYERNFGEAPSNRRIVKTSIQQQWNVTYSYEDPISM